jgi:hypothetical protein
LQEIEAQGGKSNVLLQNPWMEDFVDIMVAVGGINLHV